MKKNYFLFLFIFLFIPSASFAENYYECLIRADASKGEECLNYIQIGHICQIYDNSYTGEGIPSFCKNDCLKRSKIPSNCAIITVQASTNPEAHKSSNNFIKDFFKKITGNFDDFKENVKKVTEEAVTQIKKIDTNNEEEDIDDYYEEMKPNTYKIYYYPNKDGVKIAKIVDAFGKERYTSDGKNYYDRQYDAANSQKGIRNIYNKIGDTWSKITGIFSFSAKLKDTDKELQRQIAREILKEAKSQKEKDVETAYENLSKIINAPKLADIPAKTVIETMKEANATDFAQGVMLYIEERKAGSSANQLYTNTPEEFEGYSAFHSVSLSTNLSQSKSVLFSRYEESYQRYLLAKELGRKE